ncbi:MAG: DUF2339 domain-containing protein [Gammaproteobacteria bacterium]|nr:DUF2339 domain-containing protein [Gammaproteobacteria bacterium]
MQWIYVLAGLFLGAATMESLPGSLLGGLCGLVLAQTIRLSRLSKENSKLRNELSEFTRRFEEGTQAILKRLHAIERGEAPLRSAPEPDPEATHEKVQPPHEVRATEGTDEMAQQAAAEPADIKLPDLPFGEDLATSSSQPQPVPALQQQGVDPGQERAEAAPRRREPRGPSLLERGFTAARDWLLGGNTLARVGVVLLFLGLAFLLRYATDRVVIPIELRYAGVAASAIVLLALGWWLRLRNTHYGLILQGTGIGVLYLTVFAAMRLHPLLDPQIAFTLLVLVTICSAILAVVQNALSLAAAATLGGFAAPILASTGSGNHAALFSYFTLLNTGIFAIAWFKAWRLLNLIGFIGTFGIGMAWGLRSYTAELFWSTEPFLVLFFLMYVAIGLLFARRKLLAAADAPQERNKLLSWSAHQTDYIDATTLFGPPLAGFGLQYAIIQHLEFGPAFSALALGLLYMLLAWILARRLQRSPLLLVEACLALGVVFGTLAIPLGLDAQWTSAAWAVEGAGIYWIGLRQGRTLGRAFALLLLAGAALTVLGGLRTGDDTLLDGDPLGVLLVGLALLFSFVQLRQAPDGGTTTWEQRGTPWLAVSGLVFLYLLAPQLFAAQGTAITWALAGLATLYAGLRLQSRPFLFSAFAIQLLGGAVFLLQLDSGAGDGGVLASGWRGLMASSLIGLALVGGMVFASRDRLVRNDERLQRSLPLILLAGLAFINLAVLFVLPWRSASIVWGGSGLLILWLALRLQQWVGFTFGLALQVLAGGCFLLTTPLASGWLDNTDLRPLAHPGFWTPAVLALVAMLGAWLLEREIRREPPSEPAFNLTLLAQLLMVWGTGWWAFASTGEILRFVTPQLQVAGLMLATAATLALWSQIAFRLQWPTLALFSLLVSPVGLLILLHAYHGQYHPAANLGWLGWGAVFATHLYGLWQLDALLPTRARSAAHILGCWLILGVLALELRYLLLLLSEHYNAWRWLGWALLPSAYLLLISRRPSLPWPVAAYGREYRVWTALPLALLMLAWFWLANIYSEGAADPLPYVPLINPLELGLLFALLGVGLWARQAGPQLGHTESKTGLAVQVLAGLSLFALASAAVGRTVHHWGGVPFQAGPLLQSMQVQAGLSLVWTSIALGLMVSGHRRARRELWLTGAALTAVVVAKLFFIELGNSGGLERIISFIGVGVLLLVVGYFAPLPPRKSQSQETMDT